jgi:flavin-binding protein dodecin
VAEPFERRSGSGSRALARLFGQPRKASAMRELEDLLARADRVCDVSAEKAAEVAASCGVDLGRRFGTARRNLYRRFLEHCLVDHAVSAEESADLTHLKGILHLGDAETAEVQDQVARSVYGEAINQVLEDHRLDPEEEEFLQRLRKDLDLPEEVAHALYSEGSERSRQRFLERTISHDHALVVPRQRTLKLTGTSTTTLEDAVNQAIVEAAQAVPDLNQVEVTQIHGDVENGRVARWQVQLKAGFTTSE